MRKYLNSSLESKNLPRWVILFFDIILCFFSLILSYLLRFNFEVPDVEIELFKTTAIFVISVRLILFYLMKSYTGIVRYTSTGDAVKLFIALLFGSLVFIIGNIISYYFIHGIFLVPFSIIIIEFTLAIFALTGYRMIIKITYLELRNPNKLKKKVVIYGAGESGFITKRALDRDVGTKYKVIAFIDDDPKKFGKSLEGVSIHPTSHLGKLMDNQDIEHLIISIQNLHSDKKKSIIETSLDYGIDLLYVPPVSNWINGELSFKQIKSVNIEDLLGRDIIILDEDEVNRQLNNKVVLITGAAGSIGSEIAKQVVAKKAKKVILLDNAETPLYHIELELRSESRNSDFEVVVGDVRSLDRMQNVFETFKPQVVFHAAAYKHVPLMEDNPAEAIHTNVKGTKLLADLSIEKNVEKFVMVSTDKAVNPTNVMGASKRIAEIYVQSLNTLKKTRFITTRFGNVLGSNGSVIPLFKKQIEGGGPITVTHPDVNRFFMTIPEACRLVLEASALGKGGEIFIFDMGKSVKIVDLAKKMIKLSGLTLGKDIQIKYTGLRPGEKLYEELLNNEENTMPTHHPRIMIAKVKEYNLSEVKVEIDELIGLGDSQENFEIVKKMKLLMPEYKSNNSIYSTIDNK